MISLASIGTSGVPLPLDVAENKGVVWWIGTNKNTQAFSNPHTAGNMTATWVGNGTGVAADTVNRAAANTHTTSTVDSWWKLDISTTGTRRLEATHMRCQNRSTHSDQTPNNAIVQGSNDDLNWVTLCTVTPGQFNSAASSWTTLTLDPSYGAFRYFKFQFTSTNTSSAWYICICEYELFGTLFG